MCDDFMEDVIEYDAIMPGIVFGTVDVVCSGCGELRTHKVNPDGSNLYWCPRCEEVTEI